jgi:hypothetical protein
MTPANRLMVTRRQLSATISRLNRSRAGQASTGSFLENMSKLLQILAIVVGGAWVLTDYFEFSKSNKSLTNRQAELAITTATLTQSGLELNNKLADINVSRTTEGRLDVYSDSSVVQSAIFPDKTALYRFQVSVNAKNMSDGNVLIPAIVIEFFLGTNTIKDLKPGQAFLINQPGSWLDEVPPGSISWSRLTAVVQKDPPHIDGDLAKIIADFTPIAGGFVGVLPRGGSTHWNADFVVRARPEDMAAAVITFWERGENYQIGKFVHTRTELLSEAEDASSPKAQDQHVIN